MAEAATTLRLQLLARLRAEPQHLRRDERADAVVARARDVDVAVELLPADDVGDEIADRDALLRLLAVRRADVDEELVQLRILLLLAASCMWMASAPMTPSTSPLRPWMCTRCPRARPGSCPPTPLK